MARKSRAGHSGFGSPGSDFTVKCIDFNDALIRHPQATFVMRMSGDAMREAGILDSDMLVVDRAVGAVHEHIVIAKLDGELAWRRLVKADGIVALETAEPTPSRDLRNEERPLEVWSVVTFVIHPVQLGSAARDRARRRQQHVRVVGARLRSAARPPAGGGAQLQRRGLHRPLKRGKGTGHPDGPAVVPGATRGEDARARCPVCEIRAVRRHVLSHDGHRGAEHAGRHSLLDR